MPSVKQYIYVVAVRAPGMTVNDTRDHIKSELETCRGQFNPDDPRFDMGVDSVSHSCPEFLRRLADVIEREEQKENRAP